MPESPETFVHARTTLGHKALICDRYCLISPKRSERSPVGKASFTGLRGETVWKIAEGLLSVLGRRQEAADRGP